jgi:hypothetical protein
LFGLNFVFDFAKAHSAGWVFCLAPAQITFYQNIVSWGLAGYLTIGRQTFT